MCRSLWSVWPLGSLDLFTVLLTYLPCDGGQYRTGSDHSTVRVDPCTYVSRATAEPWLRSNVNVKLAHLLGYIFRSMFFCFIPLLFRPSTPLAHILHYD